MSKIDNDKMWASLIRHCKVSWVTKMLKKSLEDQGLEYNPKTKEIEETKPKFKIEAGKWYMCIKDEPVNHYTKGKIYQSQSDYTLPNDLGEPELVWESIFDVDSLNLYEYFRPATPEEIPHSKSDQEELTEFEKELLRRIHYGPVTPETFKQDARIILNYCRKQITSDIDVDAMADEYYNDFIANDVNKDVAKDHRDSFVMGVEAVLKAIKGE